MLTNQIVLFYTLIECQSSDVRLARYSNLAYFYCIISFNKTTEHFSVKARQENTLILCKLYCSCY